MERKDLELWALSLYLEERRARSHGYRLGLRQYRTNARLCPCDTGYPKKHSTIEGNMEESV